MIELGDLLFVAPIVFICVLFQSMAGFGFGLLATPMLVWAGMPVQIAVAICMCVSGMQMGAHSYQMRHDVQWNASWPFIACRVLLMPVGTWMLVVMSNWEPSHIKAVIGGIILVTLFVQWKFRIQPRDHIAMPWTIVAGSISGVLVGLIGMGGPPVALWIMGHNWTARQQRATMFITMVATLPINLVLIWLSFGEQINQSIVLSLICLPIIIVGATIGMKLGNRLTSRHLRKLVFGVLLVLAVSSLAAPLLEL